MIHHVDKALESFLRQKVPLAETDVDLVFRAPDANWAASIARPTVNVFLWDIGRGDRTSTTGRDERLSEDGRRQQRPTPTQVALRYFMTVWAREQRDEHELLGLLLRGVLSHDELPATMLPPSMAETHCRLFLAGDQHRLPPALWGGAPAKPGIYLEIELGVDTTGWLDRGLPVEQYRLGVSDRNVNPPPGPAESDDRPPLRRLRSGGALVMEGRPSPSDGNGANGERAGGDQATGEHEASDRESPS
ncbi:MAG TPA: Pvc16 family protein [Acidimicrobiales bacterium]|nr:Pvc16 family protein [Acidimicrobiales bacterium]